MTRIASAVIVVPFGKKSMESISASGANSGDDGKLYLSAMLSCVPRRDLKCGFDNIPINS